MNASKGSAGGMMDSAIKKLTEQQNADMQSANEPGSPSNAAELCVYVAWRGVWLRDFRASVRRTRANTNQTQ